MAGGVGGISGCGQPDVAAPRCGSLATREARQVSRLVEGADRTPCHRLNRGPWVCPRAREVERVVTSGIEQVLAATEWAVWTTTARLVVTDQRALAPAAAMVKAHLGDVDRAASRFRPDSEVCRLASSGDTAAEVSPLLRDLVKAALSAAEMTAGDVDPTLGTVLSGLGYAGEQPANTSPHRGAATITTTRRTTWRDVRLRGATIEVPPGTLLDLGATAKAWAADRCARLVADRLDCGVLVSLGGDLCVAGPEPEDGWRILVQDGVGEPASTVRLSGASAVATSSTLHRRWLRGDQVLHHIVDPLTGWPADQVWRTATVAADTCLHANTLSTAALVRGHRAPDLLARAEVDARLVGSDGTVRVFGGWPA
jgi:FAD:protein FMN transferase